MNLKKNLCALTSALFLLFPLFSCRSDPNPELPSAEDSTETDGYFLNTLPREKYDYQKLTVAAIQDSCPPEDSSAATLAVDQALYSRDSLLRSHFNIDISYLILSGDDKEEVNQMLNYAQGQMTDEVDFFIQQADNLMSLAINGACVDLTGITTLNLDNLWWCQSLNDNLTLSGSLYLTAGPVTQWYYGAPIAMAFNKKMADSYEIPDIYETVESGNWTLETLEKIVKDYGIYDENSGIYPISYTAYAAQHALFASAGGTFATVDEDRGIVVDLGSEKNVNIMQKILAAFDLKTSYGNTVPNSAAVFTDGKALFWRGTVGYFETYLKGSEIDYGVIPCPKYDTQQTDYISCGWASSNFCVAVPKYVSGERLEWCGMMLEAYGFLGYDMIKPIKYDGIVKYQVAIDPTGAKMLDIIFDHMYFDINMVANFGGSRDLVDNVLIGGIGTGRLSSAFKAIEGLIEQDISQYDNLLSNKKGA